MKKAKKAREVPAAKLRWRCTPSALGFRTTTSVRCCDEIIGQPRAVAALRLGLEFPSPGYNVFVCGLTGTGKMTTIKKLLEEMDLPGTPPDDLCYVHNFRQPEAPRAITLPAGRGRGFRQDMQDLVETFRKNLVEVYESKPYQERRRALTETFQEKGRHLFQGFEARVQAAGFQIVQVQIGPITRADIYPVVEGEPMGMEKLHELVQEKRFDAERLQRLQETQKELVAAMAEVLKAGRNVEREQRAALRALEREFGELVVRGPLQDLHEKYRAFPAVLEYLRQIDEHVLDALPRFAAADESEEDGGSSEIAAVFDPYRVNVAVDNTGARKPPVVIETAPTFRNLFGSIERVLDRQGVWRADFTMIRAGSLLAANGGFLVLNLHDAALEPAVWPTLKRMLKNMKSEIQTFDPFASLVGSAIKPDPVDLKLTVVLIGDTYSYHILYEHDDEFRKIFKVKADFDSTMRRDRAAIRNYAQFVATLVEHEGLLPFDAGAVAAVLESGARLAGRQDKLSTRFSDIADLVREAHYWATKERRSVVGEAHVDRAARERVERVNLVERKLQEAFDSGEMLLELRGKRVGQVNALTVYDLGDHTFGRPVRITSEVSMGRTGIINIEREVNLSGSTHDKGVLILAGYLRRMYAQDKPLTLSASLAFEQSYGGVDGDSASAAELFALLSAIGNLPVRQDLAVTGSVDQKGQIQPVGGINEKIEGFFDVCRARGLTGTQGVLIPHQNVKDLMLRKDVVEAVRRGRFHVFPLRRIEDGFELMSGLKAGRRTRYRYEPRTFHRLIDDALYELAEAIKAFVDGADTPAGKPQQQGLSDDDGDEGVELRRQSARRRASRRRA